jgi:hypothetical protein
VDNQHKHIKGYRDLSEAEIKAMNEVKHLGETLGAAVEAMEGCYQADGRWVAIGKTHLQQGLMALTRAIAKPEGF